MIRSYGSRAEGCDARWSRLGMTRTPRNWRSRVYRACRPAPDRCTLAMVTWHRIASRILSMVSVRTEPESRSASGRIMSTHSTRYAYSRVAARWVYSRFIGGRQAAAATHDGMCSDSSAAHLPTKCRRLRATRSSTSAPNVECDWWCTSASGW
eukprot:scaffold30345_cov90-Isochrysis_galbana.AAC.3